MENIQSLRMPNFALEYYDTDGINTTCIPHCHDTYEVYCCFRGTVYFDVEGVRYQVQPGDILLLNRTTFHNRTVPDENRGYRRVVLHVGKELFHPEEAFLLDLFTRDAILYPGAWEQTQEVYRRFSVASLLPEPARDIAIRTITVQIFLQLFAMRDKAIGHRAEKESLEQVIGYINAHLTEPLTLKDLADHFYMSRNTLDRQFRRATGTTVSSYIMYKRMACARELLKNGVPAKEAAERCGFAEYSTFYRGYEKMFNQSPSEPVTDEDGCRQKMN